MPQQPPVQTPGVDWRTLEMLGPVVSGMGVDVDVGLGGWVTGTSMVVLVSPPGPTAIRV